MLTILCSPKPFVDEAAWNQLNALRSWRAIHPDVEIIVFGAPEGAAEAAAEVGATLVPAVVTSPSGAPSFNAMAAYAEEVGRHAFIVYANCDILLNETIMHAMSATRQRFGRFLLVGERLDLAQGVTVDVRQPYWAKTLSELVAEGRLTVHGPTGADYFGFVRGMWVDLPPVFMGRAMCDQALIHSCLKRRIPIIDSTLAVVNVHQYHGYQHVQGGQTTVFAGEDRTAMARTHGLKHSLPTITDADYEFTPASTIRAKRQHLLRRAELVARYRCRMDGLALFLRSLQYLGGKHFVSLNTTRPDTILAAWSKGGRA